MRGDRAEWDGVGGEIGGGQREREGRVGERGIMGGGRGREREETGESGREKDGR